MIGTFGNELARALFNDRRNRATRSFPPELHRIARRKLLFLHDAAELGDLKAPQGNRLKQLKREWKGYYSIRINDLWRLVFRWKNGNAFDVRITDYH